MSGAISDAAVIAVLHPFVRATRPVLDALRDADPFGLRDRVRSGAEKLDRKLSERMLDRLASIEVPGTSAWADMSVAERHRWWVHRVGRFTTLVASVPGIGGALASRLPVQSALGAAGQGLLLCAMAGESGVRDPDDQVALLGAVLFRRDLRPALAAREQTEAGAREVDDRAAELTGELGEPGATPTLKKIGGAVWRLGRALYALGSELDKRPHGRFYHELLALLPVVGVVGKYLGEWSGLKRAARRAAAWLDARPGAVPSG